MRASERAFIGANPDIRTRMKARRSQPTRTHSVPAARHPMPPGAPTDRTPVAVDHMLQNVYFKNRDAADSLRPRSASRTAPQS